MRRFILITIALAVLVALIIYVDFATLIDAVAGLPRTTLILLLMLATVSAVFRAMRWAYYLRAAKLDISFLDGMISYLAGMSAAAVPGGSWVPVRLAQEHGTVRMRQAAPALFIAFVADTMAISLLAWAAMVLNHKPGNYFVLPGIGLSIVTLLVIMGRSERVWLGVDRFLSRFRLTRRLLPKEADIHQSVSALMRWPVIARGVAFSVATTLLATTTLLLVINGLTFRGVSPQEALYVHTYSESAAIAVPIPGFGVTDSSMAGLLASISIGFVRATYVVLAIRSVDLLYKTIVGSIILVTRYHGLLASALQLRRRARRAWRTGRVWTIRGVRFTGLLAAWRVFRPRAGEPTANEPSPPAAPRNPASSGVPAAPIEPARPSSITLPRSVQRDTHSNSADRH
jgi:putative heme transporter